MGRIIKAQKSKREIMEEQIYDFVRCILNLAEQEDKLDFINISISNHIGNLQMDYTLRDRKKAY